MSAPNYVAHITLPFLYIADAQAFSNAFFGQGSGPIYLDSLQCSGSELDLFDCPGDTTPSCTHADDAGARCNPIRTHTCNPQYLTILLMSSLIQPYVRRMQ